MLIMLNLHNKLQDNFVKELRIYMKCFKKLFHVGRVKRFKYYSRLTGTMWVIVISVDSLTIRKQKLFPSHHLTAADC